MTAAPSERSASNKAAGVFLGILEDLIATTLLVAALVTVECIGVVASRVVEPRVRYRLLTSLAVCHLGLLARFLAALTLAIVWLAIVAADLLLVCTRQIRLTTTYDRSSHEDVSHIRHDVFFKPEAIVGVGGVALLLAGLFTWTMDLTRWLPSTSLHQADDRSTNLERTRLSTASSPHAASSRNATPTYVEANFVVFPSTPPESGMDERRESADSFIDGFLERHVTIVSAGGDIDEYHQQARDAAGAPFVTLRLSQPVVSKRPRSLTYRHRSIAMGVAALAMFVLVESVVLAIAKTASPVVASIALNATLNEIMRALVGVEFLPKLITR